MKIQGDAIEAAPEVLKIYICPPSNYSPWQVCEEPSIQRSNQSRGSNPERRNEKRNAVELLFHMVKDVEPNPYPRTMMLLDW
jgi:hypothetical protein